MNVNGCFRSMASGRAGVMMAVALAFASATVTSCGGAGSTPDRGDPPVKKYGTIDAADYARPSVDRPGALLVPGCCTLLIDNAKAETLNSDSHVSIVHGDGFKMDIAFGFYEGSETSNDRGTPAKRIIDGVELRRTVLPEPANESEAEKSYLWTAEVPVTAAAEARGLIKPSLRIEGQCGSRSSCEKLTEAIDSIRF